MGIELTDRVALVTGGVQGIGLGIAEAFLDAGAKVAISDINGEGLKAKVRELQGRFGENVYGITADCSQEDDIVRMVAEAVGKFGVIDILVNNAGRGGMHYFWEMAAHEWDEVVDLNLRGAFLCTREVTKVMLEKGTKGKIINIASTNAILPTTGIAAYCASKGGLLMFTRVAAQELGPHGINVNAIGPGSTMTPITEGFYNLPIINAGFLERTPMGRFGQPEDIAKAALFLASEYADWVTGQILYVDGGQSLMGLPRYLEGLVQSAGG
ncbi:MAG TPA: SDR family oxidoreductase [Dehalococcoidia bacterium]|nr:SDR family oxidoreductase [Dehalococcoidia bacterium]